MGSVVLIMHDSQRERAHEVYEEMRRWLEQREHQVLSCEPVSSELPPLAAGAELAISLGGDGTFLSCARLLAGNPIPILPVHLGTFGFITEVTQAEWADALSLWFAGKLEEESRLSLEAKVERGGRETASFVGINDAVISTSGISKILRLSLDLAGTTQAGHFRGDGMIISTPLGSTAYSMAAGGPILHPAMNALVLTPICPFSLSWRPLILPCGDVVKITVDPGQRSQVILTVDGQELYPLKDGDLVRISGRPRGARVIRSDRREFYEVVRSKLGWSGGPYV